MADQQIQIGEYGTSAVVTFPTVLPVGTHTFRISPKGNAILSTVLVGTTSGTVEVKYFDFGASNKEQLFARVDLRAHPVLGQNSTDRRIVTRIHNNVQVEVIVSGGPAEVGVLASVVSDFPADIQGQILNGQLADLMQDGGLPISIYDPSDGRFYLARGANGAIATVIEPSGPPLLAFFEGTTTPGVPQTFQVVVPATKTWKLTRAIVVCREQASFRITNDTNLIGSGRCGETSPNVSFPWQPYTIAVEGETIAIELNAHADGLACSVEAYLMGTEE